LVNEEAQAASAAGERGRAGAATSIGFDLAVVVAMLVVGYAVRRDALPSTSLWFDDAWVVAGAMHFTPSQLIIAGSAHPGFTIALRVLDEVFSGNVGRLAYLPFVAGCIAGPCIYLWLRDLRFARSISVLLSAPVVIGTIPVLYSGRVKPYTLDVLLALVVFAAVPRLAARTWGWPAAALWVGAAVVLGSFSGNVMMTTAVAAVLLALHPAGDRGVRTVATAVQGILQLLLYMSYSRASDLAAIERFMNVYDGHVDFFANPREFLDEVLTHMGRIAEVYPGGSGTWLRVIAVAALVGLVIGAVRPHHRAEALSSRLALTLLGLAFFASLFDRFPFGPSSLSLFFPGLSPGSRHSLWLVPLFALGLAVALSRIAQRLGGVARPIFNGAAIVASIAVLVVGYARPLPYPSGKAPEAAAFVDELAESADAIIIADTLVYAYALYTDRDVVLVATPEHQVGFTPTPKDARFHGLGLWSERRLDADEIRAIVTDADEVVVYDALIGPGSDERVVPVMRAEGFTSVEQRVFGNDLVTLWRRDATPR
jgi:hypothetical protein